MIDPAFISSLRLAGVPSDMILAAIEIYSTEQIAAKREAVRIRVSRSRAKNKSNEINDRVTDVTHVTVTDVTTVTSLENDEAARVYNTTRAPALIPVVISNDITPINKKTNKKDFAAPAVAVSEDFEKFWAAYPKKRAKDSALKNFQKAVKSGADPADLIEGAERYAKEVAGFDEQYIKYPQGWLTEGRWKDEPANRGPPSQQKQSGFQFSQSGQTCKF
jgi:hypothetical protein